VVVCASGLCFLDEHPPFSIQCFRQILRGQSLAMRDWPQPATGHLPVPLAVPWVTEVIKIGSEGSGGETLGDFDCLRKKEHCSPLVFLRRHCSSKINTILIFNESTRTYHCKRNTLVPVLVAIDRHIWGESTAGGAVDSSKSYVDSEWLWPREYGFIGLRHGCEDIFNRCECGVGARLRMKQEGDEL
jgi:hypothetical protein